MAKSMWEILVPTERRLSPGKYYTARYHRVVSCFPGLVGVGWHFPHLLTMAPPLGLVSLLLVCQQPQSA